LGEFYVDEIDKEKIILKRKRKIKNGYNKIMIRDYKDSNDLKLNDKKVEDFNLIYKFDTPDWVKKNYISFDVFEIKSVVLVIDSPDRKIRKTIYNCVNINELIKSFYGEKAFASTSFNYISTILPYGIYGAKQGLPEQKCKSLKTNKNFYMRFGDWREGNNVSMDNFLKELSKKTGIKIKLQPLSIQDLIKPLSKSDKPYDLTIAVIDAVRNDELAFLKPFVNKGEFYYF
jgi:hypothetical protein